MDALAKEIIEAASGQHTLAPEKTVELCYELLERSGSNVVWEILRQSDKFIQWNHYPKGDVYDKQSHCQYYYHAHSPNPNRAAEHGHFHVFMRRKAIPEHIQPAIIANDPIKPKDQDDICHLIAIAMDKKGFPIRLFTTNRWVTGETWYHANSICQLVEHFHIDHSWPSWPTNLWLNAMMRWFTPEIKHLIQQRDAVISSMQQQLTPDDPIIYEHRGLEVISHMDIALES